MMQMSLRTRLFTGIAICVGSLCVLGVLVVLAIRDIANSGRLSLDEARDFNDFPLYCLGESYGGFALNEIRSYGDIGDLKLDPSVTFTYGDETCPENGSNCWTPIWIHVEPYCVGRPEQTLSWLHHLVSLPEYSNWAISEVQVRGVKAYRFGHSRTYLWTESSAIIVDANTADLDSVQVAQRSP